MRYGLKMPAVLSFFWIATALILCALIGIVFGVYPAWKAARFDGVEAGGFPCGGDAEDDAGQGAQDGRGGDPEKREGRGHLQAGAPEKGGAGAEENADDAADGAERDGFDEELRKDVGASCADGLSHPNFAGAFSDADEHDIHDTDSPDDQTDGSDREHQNEDQPTDLVPQIQKIVR